MPSILNDPDYQKNIAIELYEKKILSTQWIGVGFNIDYDKEVERLRFETAETERALQNSNYSNFRDKWNSQFSAPVNSMFNPNDLKNIKTVGDHDRPATDEDIKEIQRQLSQVANDPNLTL